MSPSKKEIAMPKAALADTFTDFHEITEAASRVTGGGRHVERRVARLRSLLRQAQTLDTRRKALDAERQEATRALHEACAEGKRLASQLRSYFKFVHGDQSPRLLEFGIRPRKAARDAADAAPAAGAPETAPPSPVVAEREAVTAPELAAVAAADGVTAARGAVAAPPEFAAAPRWAAAAPRDADAARGGAMTAPPESATAAGRAAAAPPESMPAARGAVAAPRAAAPAAGGAVAAPRNARTEPDGAAIAPWRAATAPPTAQAPQPVAVTESVAAAPRVAGGMKEEAGSAGAKRLH
jgi:hypothetical protein